MLWGTLESSEAGEEFNCDCDSDGDVALDVNSDIGFLVRAFSYCSSCCCLNLSCFLSFLCFPGRYGRRIRSFSVGSAMSR